MPARSDDVVPARSDAVPADGAVVPARSGDMVPADGGAVPAGHASQVAVPAVPSGPGAVADAGVVADAFARAAAGQPRAVL
jgi:hypothetical protein